MHRQETYSGGVLIQSFDTPWSAFDYTRAIALLEAQVTPRRIREAILTDEGKVWLADKEKEIQTLRNEIKSL